VRIDAFERETKASDWLELSENLCARANTNLAAAERISYSPQLRPLRSLIRIIRIPSLLINDIAQITT